MANNADPDQLASLEDQVALQKFSWHLQKPTDLYLQCLQKAGHIRDQQDQGQLSVVIIIRMS